jgi:hypothetical protein
MLNDRHAGLDPTSRIKRIWIPAFAGMTLCEFGFCVMCSIVRCLAICQYRVVWNFKEIVVTYSPIFELSSRQHGFKSRWDHQVLYHTALFARMRLVVFSSPFIR